MNTLLSAVALYIALAPCAAAQQFRILPYPDSLSETVNDTLRQFKPVDAFAASAACAIVDARLARRPTVNEAKELLAPCLYELGERYGFHVRCDNAAAAPESGLSTQVEGLLLRIPAYVPMTHPLVRDLHNALSRRNGRLFGLPAVIRRDGGSVSAVQAALDSCALPTVLRRIETGADFLNVYGGCLRSHKALKIRDAKPAPGQRLGVVLASAADDDVLRALNGSVAIPSEDGPVEILIIAYPHRPERIRLP